jgi:peptide/nickel transport system permease protein
MSDAASAHLPDLHGPSPQALMRRRARRHVGLVLGGTVVVIAVLVALLAPYLAPFDPYDQDLSQRLIAPVWSTGSWLHPLGTDGFGRDYLSRLIWGARISLTIGVSAALIACAVGCLLGLIGGYFGGAVDAAVVYLINVKLALPVVLVALSLAAITGGSVMSLILIMGFLTWDRYAVVVRSVTQQLRNREFVLSAQAAGASNAWILGREILPNLMNHIIVVASLEIATIILIEAALSFLGLGVRPPTPSWGLMVAEGRSFLFFKPYLVAIPGIAIFVLVIAINLAGDGLRDVMAPEGRE